jgi:hypothetical protein
VLRNSLAIFAGLAVGVVVVWWLSGTATFGPNGGGSRGDLPGGFWLLAGTFGVLAGGVVFAVLRRR